MTGKFQSEIGRWTQNGGTKCATVACFDDGGWGRYVIKLIELFRYNPNISIEKQEDHYLNHTTNALNRPLLRGMSGLVAYRQGRIVEAFRNDFNDPRPIPISPPYHRYAELVFRDRAALLANMQSPDALQPYYADHVHFMETDVPGNLVSYIAEEQEVDV